MLKFERTPRPDIPMADVQRSNNVRSAGYCDASRTLAVRLTHSAFAIRHYEGISRNEYEEFVNANCPGKYYMDNLEVKPCKFFYEDKYHENVQLQG